MVLPVKIPLATAWVPFGTVMWNRYEALSLGWSLTGNQLAATCGSPTTTAPSSVWNQPFAPSAGSWISCGIPS